MYAWGNNQHNELNLPTGLGQDPRIFEPTLVPGLEGTDKVRPILTSFVTSGSCNSVALDSEGFIHTAGKFIMDKKASETQFKKFIEKGKEKQELFDAVACTNFLVVAITR